MVDKRSQSSPFRFIEENSHVNKNSMSSRAEQQAALGFLSAPFSSSFFNALSTIALANFSLRLPTSVKSRPPG